MSNPDAGAAADQTACHRQVRAVAGPPGDRLDGVDCLRGSAIALVLLNHVNMRLVIAGIPYGRSLPRQVFDALAWNGQCGVQIFFAVSGFLITATSLRRWAAPGAIRPREFYRLRIARIAPLLMALLVILSLLHFTGSTWFRVRAETGGLGRALVAALTFHINVLESRRGYLPANWDVLWSLSVEETFYLFFPWCLLWLGRGRRLTALLIGLVAMGPIARTLLAGHNEVWREYSYLGGMDAIALGCLTALLVNRRRISDRASIALRTGGTLLMLFILCLSIPVHRLGLARAGLDMSLLALGTCMVIAAVAQSAAAGGKITAPLRLLGRRSYEIYLTHMFVVIGGFALYLRAGGPPHAVPILFIGVILCAAALGEFVGRWYSDPLNRLLRRRRDGAGPRAGAPPPLGPPVRLE